MVDIHSATLGEEKKKKDIRRRNQRMKI